MKTKGNLSKELSLEDLLELAYEEEPSVRLELKYENFKTEKYGTINLSASFPCFLPPEVYKEVDFSQIDQQADSVLEFFCETGFKNKPKNSLELKKIRKIASSHISRSVFPVFSEEIFKSEHWRLASVLAVATFCIDDFLQNDQGMGDLGPERAMKAIKQLQKFMDNPEDELEGGDINITMYPYLAPYHATIKAAFIRMMELSPQFRKTKQYFFRGLMDSMLGATVMQLAERYPNVRLGGDVDRAIHEKDTGNIALFEIMLVASGIQVPDEVRNTFIFQQALAKLEAMARATNDIMSLGKEILLGEKGSRVLKRVDEGEMSIEESFKLAEKEACAEIRNIVCIGRLLRFLYPNDDAVDQMVLLLGQQIDIAGHLFGGIRDRYTGVMDRVVYINETD